jgi:dihydrofolate reductase
MLLRDLADVKGLREEDGPNLVTQRSTELVHALLANDLVDAMSTFTVPVVLGGGKKLFADGSAPQLQTDWIWIASLEYGPRDSSL